MFEELMDASIDILVCVLIAPLYWCSAKLRWVLGYAIIKHCKYYVQIERLPEVSIVMDSNNFRQGTLELQQIFGPPTTTTSTLTVVKI